MVQLQPLSSQYLNGFHTALTLLHWTNLLLDMIGFFKKTAILEHCTGTFLLHFLKINFVSHRQTVSPIHKLSSSSSSFLLLLRVVNITKKEPMENSCSISPALETKLANFKLQILWEKFRCGKVVEGCVSDLYIPNITNLWMTTE